MERRRDLVVHDAGCLLCSHFACSNYIHLHLESFSGSIPVTLIRNAFDPPRIAV